MTPEKVAGVADAIRLLGEAWRGDWSDFDGRTLRSQLDELADHLADDKPFDLRAWAFSNGICPEARGWTEWCGERVGVGSCAHIEAYYASLRPGSEP